MAMPGWRHQDGEKMSAQGQKRLHRDFWIALVASLMLAGPAVASDPVDQAKPALVKAKPDPKNAQKPLTAKPAQQSKAAAKPTQKKVAAAITPHATPKAQQPHQTAIAAPIRRVVQARGGAAAEGFDRSLLDDGTFWHESGSFATWQQTGMASWYGGPRWQGKQTTSGERYDQNKLTAAHATLPIGTQVRVMRTDGRGSVIVTINDRPGSRTRIIDLSRAAAKELGILGDGIAMVTLQPL
jgi:rare lipoprotein A (peptidoglycan hydrolase)